MEEEVARNYLEGFVLRGTAEEVCASGACRFCPCPGAPGVELLPWGVVLQSAEQILSAISLKLLVL